MSSQPQKSTRNKKAFLFGIDMKSIGQKIATHLGFNDDSKRIMTSPR